MKDKTKALLMTLLLMSGVSFSSCDNTTNSQINTSDSATDVVDIPKDKVVDTVVIQQPVQTQKKQYAKATAKVKSKDTEKAETLKASLKAEKYERLSPEQADTLQKRYNAQTDSVQQEKIKALQGSLKAEKHERLSPEQANWVQKRYEEQYAK